MKKEKLRILSLASREFGMAVDRMYFPPSNKGTIKQMLKKGLLVKKRSGMPKSRLSTVHITEKGERWREKNR